MIIQATNFEIIVARDKEIIMKAKYTFKINTHTKNRD